MHHPQAPNELYSAFSFIAFVLSFIPFYWHFKARNTGTCLFMFWTGLGCLLQCVNSIVWNKNMINRAPVYCDISLHIQIALNVAVPASSLCINRQLYKIARMKTAGMTDVEKRRNLIYDLLIGIGIPILQMISGYVVSKYRYIIFEDVGPLFQLWVTPPTFVLFHAWPVTIGIISFFYCVMAIYAFYKRRRNHMQLTSGANRGQYLRLMAISSIEILGTIPLATYYTVSDAKAGVVPWRGWARMHSHSSEVVQVAGFIWRNDPRGLVNIEMFRWSLIGCAFIFFAFFGFSVEAREHYYRLYKLLARPVGKSTSTPRGTQPATSSVPYVKENGGVTNPIMVKNSRDKDSLSISLADRPSNLSFSMESTLNQDSVTLRDSDSDTESFYTAKSFNDPRMEGQCQQGSLPGVVPTTHTVSVPPAPPPVFLPTARPASVLSIPPQAFLPSFRPISAPSAPPPAFLLPVRPASMPSAPPGILQTLHPTPVPSHFYDPAKSTMPDHASSSVETV